MRLLATCITGAFIAGVVSGTWWLALGAGFLVLVLQRSYIVLCGGLVLDIWFAVAGNSLLFGGFFTIFFLLVTIVTEFIRARLFWSS